MKEIKNNMAKKRAMGGHKPPLELVPPHTLEAIAIAMKQGADKYGKHDWTSEYVETMLASTLRHLYAWWNGEDFDKESGVHHLAHAMAALSIMFQNSFDPDFDNRPFKNQKHKPKFKKEKSNDK